VTDDAHERTHTSATAALATLHFIFLNALRRHLSLEISRASSSSTSAGLLCSVVALITHCLDTHVTLRARCAGASRRLEVSSLPAPSDRRRHWQTPTLISHMLTDLL